MVLVPNAACKFLATWQGPYTVLEKIGPVTYCVRQPGRRRAEQLYHINLLKKWVGTRDQLAALANSDPVVVDINPNLSAAQKGELQHLISQFSDVFSSLPGQTNVLQHDIRTPPGVIVRQRPYRVPEACRQAIEEEVQQMLKLGVIEPSRSPWSSPIVMVPKSSVSATTSAASTKSLSLTDTPCLGWMSCWTGWEGPGISRHWTSLKATGRYPSLKMPNLRLLFPPLVATGSTGTFPSASTGHPPRSSG